MPTDTRDTLRQRYAAPGPRAVGKEIRALDHHCRNFIALSPFLILSTCDGDRNLDASPRGGDPGFVKVDPGNPGGALLIPDAPGNNRLDSLTNIVATGKAGLLFLIPGFDETLRVNGNAALSTAAEDIALCTTEKRAPKTVIRIEVTAAYLHCAKALMRSKLWAESSRVERTVLPTAGQMISEQARLAGTPETREEMEKRYQAEL